MNRAYASLGLLLPRLTCEKDLDDGAAAVFDRW